MNTNYTLMTPRYREIIYAKYQVLDHIDFKWVDHDFSLLEQRLQQIKKDYFEPNARIIIEHMDADYYLDEFAYGLGLYNLFTAFRNVDIPLFTMLLFTNCFGIQKEIRRLAPDDKDRPTVIETFITNTHYSKSFDPVDLSIDQIQRAGICMMGQPRVHRHAMYNFLQKENLLEQVATSVQPNP
jgi:hypothetical protein